MESRFQSFSGGRLDSFSFLINLPNICSLAPSTINFGGTPSRLNRTYIFSCASPFFAIRKDHVQPKDVPYICEYLLPCLEILPAIKVSGKKAWGKRSFVNMRSLVGNLREREGVKQVLTPLWVVLVTVWFARFAGIFQQLASVKWSTGCTSLDFILPAFEFDVISETETLTWYSSTQATILIDRRWCSNC